jgi:hypothetical protein
MSTACAAATSTCATQCVTTIALRVPVGAASNVFVVSPVPSVISALQRS